MDKDWFQTDTFDTPLPPEISAAVKQFYGTRRCSVEFAQMLASFLKYQGGGTEGDSPDNPGWVLSRPS